MEGDLRRSLVQLPAQNKVGSEVQSSVEKKSKAGTCTTFLGNLIHCLRCSLDCSLERNTVLQENITFLIKAFAYLSVFPLLSYLNYILATKSQYTLLKNLFLYI